MDELTFR
jgi:2-polyprenyl-6-methoxyphenol hydroxylase-like FAD-dependent oxidoreductase